MRHKSSYAIKGIGIVLFLWFFLRVDRAALAEVFATASPKYLIAAFLLFPVIYGIKSLRWQKLMEAAGLELSFGLSARMYCAGLFLGILTPGKVGEAIKIPMLKSHNLPLRKGVIITVADRVLDAALLGSLALVGLLVLEQIHIPRRIIFICVILCMILLWQQRHRWLKQDMWKELQRILKAHCVQIVLLTILNWIVYFVQLALIAKSLSLTIPLVDFVSIMTIAGIVSLLPIAPAGLGTRDATLLFFFAEYGISPPQILAFSYSIFTLTIIAATCIGGYCLLTVSCKKESV